MKEITEELIVASRADDDGDIKMLVGEGSDVIWVTKKEVKRLIKHLIKTL